MNQNSLSIVPDLIDTRPILIVPYMWIGDFVRGHTVVRLLKERWPNRPVDMLVTKLNAPIVDYMPGLRQGIVSDLPRRKLALKSHRALAEQIRAQNYGTVFVMPRTWKSALAPALAGIPERVGFVGEFRFGLINDWRWGEKKLPRMIDKKGALVLPDGVAHPEEWPVPQLRVSADEIATWRATNNLGQGAAVALAPGSVGSSKRWTYYAEAAKLLTAAGLDVWVVGGPAETPLAQEIVAAAGPGARDLTTNDMRNGVVGMAAASVAVCNDSGLMHVAAALGTPTIGIFGPTDPALWGPLNPLAATIVTKTMVDCQPCHRPVCTMVHHRCMREIPATDVATITARVLADARAALAHLTPST